MKTRRIALVAYDGVQALDVVGPADVFAGANQLLGRKPPAYEIVMLSPQSGPVASECGVRLHADASLAQGGLFDTILVPGGKGVRLNAGTRTAVAEWTVNQARVARRVASVCTGIYALAETGLLDGRNVTTHWRYASDVQRRWPSLRVNANAIFLQDGKYYTSAGVTAGIDLALSFVEADFGSELALAVARDIVVYLKRSGGQLQYSQPLLVQTQAKTRFADLAEWIRGNLQADLTLEVLSERVNLSPRHFARKFKATFGLTPADFVQELRLDEARWLLVNAEDPISELAQSIGYTGDDTFRRAFERRFGVPPAEYRRRFRPASA